MSEEHGRLAERPGIEISRAHPEEKGLTVTPRNPLSLGGERPAHLGGRIDYIFVGCDDHGPSDHLALVADLVPA